ncbi:MAG TPA: alpha/beta hydrolase-fold protein [Thermoanaerobaculia bacterium]|nr:alpha/beta hydrolase-fold protein [Thermoanaerobaculia bacterium]
MRRGFRLLFFLVTAAIPGCASSPVPGLSVERIRAASLPDPADVLVLLPPSYARQPQKRYPVLYFLHDGYGDAKTLLRRGVAASLHARMEDGSLPEFLVVAPGAEGTWFSDFYDGSRRFERFLAEDLPREIAARYRVLEGAPARAVTGISMGGYGAFKLALKHPGLYGSVSSLSGALIPFEQEDLERYNWFARWTLRRVFGADPRKNSLAENDVWKILGGLRFEKPPFAAHLRAGTSDFYGLDGVAAQFGAYLTDHGAPATVVLEPGGHDWDYWRSAMLSIARWHGKLFEYDSP